MLDMGMGTGKTFCVLKLREDWGCRRVLVLCPLSVGSAWIKQIKEHAAPGTRWLRLAGRVEASDWPTPKAKKIPIAKKLALIPEFLDAGGSAPAFVILNYEMAVRMPAIRALAKVDWDLVVMDESHKLKAPWGETQKNIRNLVTNIPRRLALTGTPMPHSPEDIFAQYRLLDPKIFGWSYVKFLARYAVRGGFGGKEIVDWTRKDEFKRKLDSIKYHCTADVLDLPPKRHVTIEVDLSDKARKVYSQLELLFFAGVGSGEITASNALVKLLRLQQLTSGRAHLDDGGVMPVCNGKARAISDLVEGSGKDKIVFFCRFLGDLDMVKAACEEHGEVYSELSGRARDLEAWQEGGGRRVLATQIQAGGVGVDMSSAPLCVYVSLGFSLGDYEQSLARVHRPGQTKPVAYYHLIAKDTIDERVYGALRAKKKVIESILTGVERKKVTN